MEYSDEVAAAKARGAPIVALESTIITHGMPYPRQSEHGPQRRGDHPRRRCRAGDDRRHSTASCISALTTRSWKRWRKTEGAMKLSRADLAFAIAERRTGATTVAATMIAAARAGIRVFATGGIGGVHRKRRAELRHFRRPRRTGTHRPSSSSAAGAKAILDIPKTLEVLETRGVPVVTYDSDIFPAFWSRDSGLKSPLMLNSPAAIANFQNMRDLLGVDGGMLIANPVPAENEIPRDEMEIYIARALDNAERDEISGKEVTPVPARQPLWHMTDGRSLETNIALVENNARLAGEIAVALTAK